MFKRTRLAVTLLLASILMISMVAPAVFAKSAPAAFITTVSGDVIVKKAGGSKPIPAFVNMPLEQGDFLSTGREGSLTIQIVEPESTRTLGPGSEATIKKLSQGALGKRLGIMLWKGSMWNSVHSLKSNEEDYVETPAAKLEVKGTNFLVTVKADGTLSVAVASGLVTASITGVQPGASNSSGGQLLLAPTQQLTVDPNHPPVNLQNSVSIIDITQTVTQADAGILKAFMLSAPAIFSENEAFLQGLASSLEQGKQPSIQREGIASDLTLGSSDELEQLKQNLNALISNVAASAIALDPEKSAELLKLIEDVNRQIPGTDSDVDIQDTKFDPTVGVDPAAVNEKEKEQARLRSIQRQQEQERADLERRLLLQLHKTMDQLISKMNELSAGNKSVLDELQQQAEQTYMGSLTAEELARYKEDKVSIAAEQAATPSQSAPISSGPSGPSQPAPSVELIKQNTAEGLTLKIQLHQFTGTNAVYAAEYHFAVEGDIQADPTKGRLLNDQYFQTSNSVDTLRNIEGPSGSPTEAIYAATSFGSASPVSISNGTMATIPFAVHGSGTIRLVYAKIVDQTGAVILELNSGSTALPAAISVTR
ncbi:FecR domain-containing protein [Cohnella yongneupensis]|uniref:FecR domain-containing protein n=1 Tax=Cohnella yongneupensis TaxID=425006 RepID=A0ABW0R4L4_9BACL